MHKKVLARSSAKDTACVHAHQNRTSFEPFTPRVQCNTCKHTNATLALICQVGNHITAAGRQDVLHCCCCRMLHVGVAELMLQGVLPRLPCCALRRVCVCLAQSTATVRPSHAHQELTCLLFAAPCKALFHQFIRRHAAHRLRTMQQAFRALCH
jgi:hypothetical protein